MGCTGGLLSDCIACKNGFFNISGLCEPSCPNGTVPIQGNTCGCEGDCLRCSILSTRCTACTDSSKLLYNEQCVDGCPNSTYLVGQQCRDCSQGCLSCTSNACLQCLNGYNVYENQCFS